MPHWVIYHPPCTFEDEATKGALAEAITSHYRDDVGMPAFYVVVNFIKSQPSDQWVGGQMAQTRGKPFIRIVVTHIHIRLPEDPSIYERLMNRLNELIKPHIEEKGYDWEVSIDETDRRLWRINGLAPPEFKSEDEKAWIAENRPVKPDGMALKR